MIIKFISWNVNGLRSLAKKPEWHWLSKTDAQIIGLQETKAAPEQLEPNVKDWPGGQSFWSSSTVKKGYSGVSVFSRIAPENIAAELPDPRYQGEGRLLHLEYPEFHFFNGYFPNGGAAEVDEDGLPTGKFKRVPYKLGFFNAFLELAIACQKTKPVVVCGDFNIAHKPIDLAMPDEKSAISGFLPEERAWLDKFTAAGFVDSFRYAHGQLPNQYTWWSYQGFARKKNNGWRLDYFFVSENIADRIREAKIYSEIKGSDHCPIGLTLDI